jgi:acyl-CoA thioesterase
MEETYHGDPFGQHLGLKIVSMENGVAQISLSIEPHHLNAIHVVHGGALYSLIDHAMGAALFTKLSEGEICATLEIKIHYLNPARKGILQAKAEVIDRKRQIAVLTGEIRSGGTLVAKAMGSFYIFLRGTKKVGS